MVTRDKLEKLKSILKGMQSVVVAYSGGVDSSFLLKVARDCLGKDKVLAVTALSETYPKKEISSAREFCRRFNIKQKIIRTRELEDDNFRLNPPKRCYFCKKELFSCLKNIACEYGFKYILDGTNVSDKMDYRPGRIAKKEFKVRSPLEEAGISKTEVRALSKKLKLPVSGKPALACLASRIPYGKEITKASLERIEKAEGLLQKEGLIKGDLRLRDYGDLARIEIKKNQIPKLIKNILLIEKIKKLGFKYVTVDLEGYRTGSMNEVIKGRKRYA